MALKRWMLAIGVLTLLAGGATAGFWYFGGEPEDRTSTPTRPAEYFLPDNPRLLVRFNHSRAALENLNELAMVKQFKTSRFREALTDRIIPLLSLVSDQVRANTPYPSQQLLRHFRNSVSYLTQGRGQQPVFLMTPSSSINNQDGDTIRDMVEEWILSPARNRSNWSVTHRTVLGNPTWRLTYSLPDTDKTVSLRLATVQQHLLLSPSGRSLSTQIKLYQQRENAPYEFSETDDQELVNFIVSHDAPDTTSRLFAEGSSPISRGSAKRLRGTVRLNAPYLTVSAKAAFPDTIPVGNISLPRTILSYLPTDVYALNVFSVPDFDSTTPSEYRRLLKHRARTILPGQDSLMGLIGSLEGLRFLENQEVLSFASFYSDENETSRQSFLIVLKPTDPTDTREQLEEYRQSAQSESDVQFETYEFGPVSAHGLWEGGNLLLAGSTSTLSESLDRQRNETGFLNGRTYENHVRDRVPDKFTSFSYFSTAPLSDGLKNGEPIRNSQYQLAKTFLGFDPMSELGRLVRDVPPNVLVTRREPDRNVSLKFHTAGDVFLPIALQRLNPKYRPTLRNVPRNLPFAEDLLSR